MLFLLNDTVLQIDPLDASIGMEVDRFRAITPSFVLRLGAELFAEDPMLHRSQPERARRLGLMISAKTPKVNAALFVAPRQGCPPDQVVSRLAEVSFDVMASLYNRYREGMLTPSSADREVWRRMAA